MGCSKLTWSFAIRICDEFPFHMRAGSFRLWLTVRFTNLHVHIKALVYLIGLASNVFLVVPKLSQTGVIKLNNKWTHREFRFNIMETNSNIINFLTFVRRSMNAVGLLQGKRDVTPLKCTKVLKKKKKKKKKKKHTHLKIMFVLNEI